MVQSQSHHNLCHYTCTISKLIRPRRDRLLWPGDIAVSGPSIYGSIGDADPILNGLIQLFSEQNSLGQLPYVGKPQGFAFSFTYHLHTLIDVYDYFMYTGNTTSLNNLWPQYVKAIDYSVGTIDSSGLAYVSDANGKHSHETKCYRLTLQ